MLGKRITFVGECNPLSADPRLALWPDPPGSTGARICRILGLTENDYLRMFQRMNICSQEWVRDAAERGAKRVLEGPPGRRIILLGTRVASAFGLSTEPFQQHRLAGSTYLVLPHPSGRCRVWNDPGAAGRAMACVRALSLHPRFDVVLADPPWAYRNFTAAAHGAAAAHYAGMEQDDIAAIPVGQWVARDAALLLWATWPKLLEALRVVEAWGFCYVTAIPWVKTVPSTGNIYRGVGFWSQAASEVLLVGRRGHPRRERGDVTGSGTKNNVVGLLTGDNPRVFWAPRKRHSAKPEGVQDWLERIFPAAEKLELFSRRERPGWTSWGDALGWRLSASGLSRCEPTRRRGLLP